MFATCCLPKVSPGADDERDDYGHEIDRINVNCIAINRNRQGERPADMLRHSRAFEKESGLAKNDDSKSEHEPAPRTAQNSSPTFLPPSNGETKKIQRRQNERTGCGSLAHTSRCDCRVTGRECAI